MTTDFILGIIVGMGIGVIIAFVAYKNKINDIRKYWQTKSI